MPVYYLSSNPLHILPGERPEDVQLAVPIIRHPQIQQFVEAAGAQQGRVEQVRPVCRPNDEHISGLGHSVYFGQELGYYPV